MADLDELNYDDLDELDIETLLARVERKPLTFSRKQNLKQAPEFMQRLSGKDTVLEGEDTQLECIVNAFPRPDLTWYKDSDLILPDHPRMTAEEGEEGKYYLKIKNVSKGDEAGYKCKAENCEGTSASTFFLFVNVKPKRSPKNKNKRRRVSYPPMFSTIVEKVEEEEIAAKEARFAPPSPLSELYVGITLKSRHTWPKFLGDWAFAEDAIRSCSDETESPPTSPDGSEEKINVKVKVSNKPVKSILKTRRRPEERESSEDQKSSKDQPPPKDAVATAVKKSSENGTAVAPSTTSAAKTSTKRTESRKTTTTTTTTTTKTTKTTSTTKANGKPSTTTDSGKTVVSTEPSKPAVTTKSETKALESKQQDAISIKGTETKTTTNGSAATTSTTSTTKSNTRTLTAHRVEETRQTVKQQAGRPETKTTPSSTGPGKPSPQEQVALKKAPFQIKPAEATSKEQAPSEEKKPLSKTQSLQERLIKKTLQTSSSAGKKISTGSLGISKITEKLTGAPPAHKDNGAVKISPTKTSPTKTSPTKTSPTKDLKSSPTKVIATTSATGVSNGQKATTVSQSSTLTTSSSSMKSVTQTTKSSASNGAIISNGPLKSVTPTTPAASTDSPKQLTTVNQSKQPQAVSQPSASPKQQTPQQSPQQPPSPQKQPQSTVTQKTTTTQQAQVTQKLTTSQSATVPKTAVSSGLSTTVPITATTSKSLTTSSSTTATTQSTKKTTEVQKPATLSLKTDVAKSVEASPTKLISSPSPTPVKIQPKLDLGTQPIKSPSPSPTTIQKLKGNGQSPATTSVKSPVIELPVTHQTGAPHNMALPGKPTPESNDPKYKTTTMIKTTQQSQPSTSSVGTPGTPGAPRAVSSTPTSVDTTKAPRLARQESVGVMVVNKLVVDQRNQDVRRRRERSPAITHTVTATVRSRETSPATPRARVRRERGDRGKSPIMQLLPTEPHPISPATTQPSVPSPVRYLPIISVKERTSEKVIVHQPTVASKVIDLRGIGNAKTGEIQQSSPNVVVQRSITSQPVEFVKPFGAGKDPIQGLKQTFTTQEMQTQKAETSCNDPKAGIKRSISTEKLHLIDKNTDVIASATMGPVGAKAAVVDTDVIRTKLITEQPAVPSNKVQPGMVPVQATQKEILTKETTKRTVMEVGKNNLPKGTVMIEKPGSVTTTRMIEAPRKTSFVGSLTNKYNNSTPSSGSASPYLGPSRSPSRSPSPNRMIHGDNSWQSKPQSFTSSQPALHFRPVDSPPSPQIVLSPGDNQREVVLGGSSWNTRQAPVPPKRGSSVERMLTTYNASPTRKTSLQFIPYFSRTEPKKPVDITQYLSHGQSGSRLDRSRRAQSEDRLPSIPMYPSRGAMSPPQRPPPPNWSFAAPLNRSVSVDVIPGLVETDRGFSTYQEIPVEHHMSPDSAATLPRRRKRRNSVESLTKMFDAGTPAPVDDPQGGADVSNQYQDMGQQLLSQIQAFGDASYDFEEGAATLPRTRDGQGGPRLKRRNSVGHMAKIFDQGVPVVQKDDDAIPIYGGSLAQAPINVVHPYTDNSPYNSRPPDSFRQTPLSSRLSASTPHLSSSISKGPASAAHRTQANNQPQTKTNPVVNQSRIRRAAACSLNLTNVSGAGSQIQQPSVLNQKPHYRRSLSEQPQSQNVTLRHHPAKSAEAEEVKSYKRLSVGEAARLFDQKSPESPPTRKNPSLAQKFLAKFK